MWAEPCENMSLDIQRAKDHVPAHPLTESFYTTECMNREKGPDFVVQSIVSLTSSLVVKMLSVLVSTISNSQEFLLKKCEPLLQMQKLLTFFFSKILSYMPYLMIKVLTIC